MNPEFQLFTPSRTDFSTLLIVWEASVRATHDFLKEEDIQFFKSIIQEKNVFNHVKLIGSKYNERIIGFLGVSEDAVEMLFIDPDFRGKGVGKFLMQEALKNKKITKVDVNEQNVQALGFYEHFGFRIVSRSAQDGTGKPFPMLHMELINID